MAVGATEFIDNTTADVFVPEIWSLEAIVARMQRLIYAKLFNHDFERGDIKRMGDIIHVPSRGHLSTRAYTVNTAITYETITETNVDITVNTQDYVAMALETITDIQANRDLISFYASEMGYALDLAIDDVLAGLVDNFTTNVVGALGTGLTLDDYLKAIQLLDDANAPQEERFIVLSPIEALNLMKLPEFVHGDYGLFQRSAQTKEAERGYIKDWMGMPIYKSTNVEGTNAAGHDNCMAHREAIAIVVQMKPKFMSFEDIDYLGAHKVAMTHLYGTQEMRDDHGVFLRGA